MSKYYMSYPSMVSAIGENTEECYSNCLKGEPRFFARNKDGHLVARRKSNGDGGFDEILCKAVAAIKPQAAALIARYGSGRIGAAIGGCDYNSERATAAHRRYLEMGCFGDYDVDSQNPFRPVSMVMESLGLKGPAFAVASACASGNVAAIRAIELIASGAVDAMLVGGIDYASDIITAGFHSLSALSDEPTNPFSKNRKGVTLGDGAALYFITREKVFGFPVAIAGFGESSDGYNMTCPDPKGEAVISILKGALRMAGRDAADVGYINLHGTGTDANDAMEAKAVHEVFGADVPVSSTKALTGHTLGAAGAFGTAFAALTIAAGQPAILPPHVFDGVVDDSLPPLHYVKRGEKRRVNVAISNAFAFGGANSVLLLERAD